MSLAQRVESARRDGAKILVVDIERLPGLARVWEQKTRFVPISNFTKPPSLLCFAAKWYGRSKVEFHAAWDDPAAMVQRAWKLFDQAEIVVGYNSVRFDNKHLKSEWLTAGMVPPRPWKDVDLYAVNSRTFGFESKSLNYLCHRLGLEVKAGHYDAVTAEKCMDGDPASQRLMKRYNVQDVRITEQAYDALGPWITNHPHSLTGTADDRPTCNVCWGGNLERTGTKLANLITYVLYRCKDCGANVQGTRHSRAAITRGAR